MGTHNEFGKQGEEMAAKFLQENGYEIRYRNYRYLKAEIDILAQKENVLAIVEVKSRSSNYLQEISETVHQKKINLLVMAADYFITERNLNVEARFDIITILRTVKGFEIEHLKDAFYHF